RLCQPVIVRSVTTAGSQGRRAADRYAIRVEQRGGPAPARVARAAWLWLTGLLDGWLPYPESGVVVVTEPAAVDREVLRHPVRLDTFEEVVAAMSADLDRLGPEEFAPRGAGARRPYDV